MKCDPNEVRRMWTIFGVGDNNPLSLRAIWPKGTGLTKPVINKLFSASQFPDIDGRKEAFMADAIYLNDQGYNVYIVMNPIKSSFSGSSVRDRDIDHRDLLLIDIDRAVGTDQPATAQEVEEALALAVKVEQYLLKNGWNDVFKVMSGNGVHLYCVLRDMQNDDSARKAVQTILQDLARKFYTQTTHVDTSVFNASRITKVPGTIARKGVESPDRPYRMAKVL